MLRFYCYLSTLKADRKGVTAVEYALMGALIAVAIAAGVTTLGNTVKTTFASINTSL